MKGSRFDSAPLQVPLDLEEPRWRKWFQDMWSSVQAIGLPKPSAITVGGSPFTYQMNYGGQASVIVVGAGVTKVEYSRDNVTYFQISLIAGMFSVSQGDYLRVTYGAAPTMQLVLR